VSHMREEDGFDPGDAKDTVASFIQAVHLDDSWPIGDGEDLPLRDMQVAWNLLGMAARRTVGAELVRRDRDAVLAEDAGPEEWEQFSGFLREYLREVIPLPRFDPDPYRCRLGWEAGMAVVRMAEQKGEPFFVFRLERKGFDGWPWCIHSFSPLTQGVDSTDAELVRYHALIGRVERGRND
jgi:hypothetical protein